MAVSLRKCTCPPLGLVAPDCRYCWRVIHGRRNPENVIMADGPAVILNGMSGTARELWPQPLVMDYSYCA